MTIASGLDDLDIREAGGATVIAVSDIDITLSGVSGITADDFLFG